MYRALATSILALALSAPLLVHAESTCTGDYCLDLLYPTAADVTLNYNDVLDLAYFANGTREKFQLYPSGPISMNNLQEAVVQNYSLASGTTTSTAISVTSLVAAYGVTAFPYTAKVGVAAFEDGKEILGIIFAIVIHSTAASPVTYASATTMGLAATSTTAAPSSTSVLASAASTAASASTSSTGAAVALGAEARAVAGVGLGVVGLVAGMLVL